MHASSASHSAELPAGAPERVLVIGPNWLGDSLMAMPALQVFRRLRPAVHATVLVKPRLAELWKMQLAADEIWASAQTAAELPVLAARIRRARFDRAFVLPNSFRSALAPWLARVPERIGMRGHFRRLLLTDVAEPPRGEHQKHECAAIFGVALAPDNLPELAIDKVERDKARRLLDRGGQPAAALLPGAARGPAKRWPACHFAALAGILSARGFAPVLLGSAAERPLCAEIATMAGNVPVNLAGQTSLAGLAAVLSACSVAVGNDSGGIHLAAAAGVPSVAIFGATDPAKTGPLGRRVAVLQKSALRSRNIARRSAAAQACLASILPEEVAETALQLLAGASSGVIAGQARV